ncbi:hypothetical protein GHK92_20205 [Nocardioides sp. dk4132]|uniref:hypothetical protein n=1 Tax=unclassified Nocardioides TaxID=2615069 RepID=UPI001296B0DD|nr:MULTISPECIES: hypothetical protein [unclassified Nocardioides]MQW78192.1 hypothetical protein [Nocardioides sp. dk4132]QGA06058.1 hypothetical protein GFH29_00585 [Nocardioides sp. dk884]
MTLTLVLAASDGFLALADGLRVKPTDDPDRPQLVRDDDIKLHTVPNSPALVLSSGRATYDAVPVAVILTEVLELFVTSRSNGAVDDVPAALDLEAVARACAERLTAEDLATPSQHSAGLLVVGFELGELAAFRVDVPARDFGDGRGMSSVRPVPIDPLVPVLANPAESETGAMVLLGLDSYADFLADDADDAVPARDAGYRFAGMSLAELRPAAIHRLGAWFSANSDMAASDGVGGLWSIAEVRRHGAVDVEHGLRPFD